MRIIFCTCVVVLAAATSASAAQWKGKGEVGLVLASGNSKTETANAKIAMTRETDNWKNSMGGAGLYASNETGRTAQRWDAFAQTDYSLSEKNFVFGAGRIEDDEFSGFEYQSTVSAGLGRKFINTDPTKFSGTLGVGYKFFETRDAFDENDVLIEAGAPDREGVLRGTLDLEHALTGTTKVLNKFITEAGADNTFLHNELSLQVRMTHVLALAVGYAVRHNTKSTNEFRRTDTLTTINLVYELK